MKQCRICKVIILMFIGVTFLIGCVDVQIENIDGEMEGQFYRNDISF